MTSVDEKSLQFQAKVFYALSDPARLKILNFLRDGEKCVCKIVPHLGETQPVISRQLKIMKDAGLVRFRKVGNWRYYSVVDPRIYEIVDHLSSQLVEVLSKEAISNLGRT